MRNTEKALLSALVVGVLGSLMAMGVFGAFNATTTNAGNEFKTGSVTFTDNDLGSALYNVSNVKPGDTVTKCIKATYSGTLDAEVTLYTPEAVGALAQYVDVTIAAGTQTTSTFPDCTGFTPAAGGPLYAGTLQSFAATHNNHANGVDTDPSGKALWSANDSVVYRFQATLNANAPNSAESQTTGDHSFVWEAQTV